MEARSDRMTDGSWDEGTLVDEERPVGTRISAHTLVVFDEGWGWPPGSYRVRVDGLFDFGSERPVDVVCEGQIHEPGHEAGTYAIDIEYSESAGVTRAVCSKDVNAEWFPRPELVGGLTIIDVLPKPDVEVRVRVIDASGTVIHDVEVKPLVDVVFLGPVPPMLSSYAEDLAHLVERGGRPEWEGPVDEFGLPIEADDPEPGKQ